VTAVEGWWSLMGGAGSDTGKKNGEMTGFYDFYSTGPVYTCPSCGIQIECTLDSLVFSRSNHSSRGRNVVNTVVQVNKARLRL